MATRRRWWREPLLHFLLIGAVLYAADAASSAGADGTTDEAPIVVGPALSGAPPDEVARYVEREALYREARRLGLDRGDLIIRRRLIQKMEFLIDDLAAPAPPTEAELQAWLAAHADRYRRPRRVTIEHVYFSRDRRGEAAEADARRALADPEGAAGDPYLGGRVLRGRTESDLARELGGAFAAAVVDLEPGRWHGPIPSAYGLHLVRVTAVEPARAATLDEVRARVEADLREARRAEAAAAARREIVARYRVVRRAE